jgi:hypothetical protein
MTRRVRLYQNPRFHPLPPALKTRRFTPSKSLTAAAPELIVFGKAMRIAYMYDRNRVVCSAPLTVIAG